MALEKGLSACAGSPFSPFLNHVSARLYGGHIRSPLGPRMCLPYSHPCERKKKR